MPGFVVYINRHLSSAPFFESHSHRRSRLSVSERTQPSITRSARLIPLPRAARCKSPLGCLLIAHEVWRLESSSPENFGDSAILPTDKISASLIEILSSRSHKTPACNAPRSPQGKIIDRERAVPRLGVSADRPKHNIIGPKLCNKPRASCGLITQFRLKQEPKI